MNLQSLMQNINLSFGELLSAAVSLALCLVVIRVVVKLAQRVLGRSKLEPRLQKYLLSGIKAVLHTVTIIIVVGSLGIDMTSLVALLSVASLGVTLAAEDILSNVAGGLVILSSHPFAIGDYIEASGIAGTVEEISLNHTRLVTPDGLLVMLPNKSLADSQVTNYTALGRRRVTQVITASYGDKTEDVKSACRLALERTPGILEDPPPAVYLSGYGESSIEYTIYCWCAASDYLSVRFTLSEQLRPAFEALGVEMTCNHLNVHLLEP